jgi:hypothetical protein
MKSFIRSAANWKLVVPVLFLGFVFAATAAQAQLGLEGPTGIYVTPLAYTVASPANGLGKPTIAYHFLGLGSVLGDYSTFSVTEGFAKRYEVGYTSVIHSGTSYVGSDGELVYALVPHGESLQTVSQYGKNHDFSIINGKATIISENSFKTKWVPAISVGGIFRFNDHNVINGSTAYTTGLLTGGKNTAQNTRNGDIYVVGSKTITQISKHVPVLFSAGLRGTDASLWGLAGNAPSMELRAFSSLALVFHGPYKSTIIAGTEFAQQPQQLKLGKVKVPTSLVDIPSTQTYALRIVPSPKYKLNVDLGVLHATHHEDSGLQLNVNDRFVAGASYAF